MSEDTIKLENWITPVSHYPESSLGRAQIRKTKRSNRDHYYCEGVRGYLFCKFPPKTKMTELRIENKIWMVDEPPYVWCLESFAERSQGTVLVAGLGLGIVIHFLCLNKKVQHITVVDWEDDVINLIKPLLPEDERIEIVHDNFYQYMSNDKEDRDTVIWDLALKDSNNGLDLGMEEMRLMPRLCQLKYGPKITLFRHGFDRDPAGERFVRENGEKFDKVKLLLERA